MAVKKVSVTEVDTGFKDDRCIAILAVIDLLNSMKSMGITGSSELSVGTPIGQGCWG
ncbi:hypothetical protein [Brevibacterium otitidis]|uniref:Uncharacterized protein n=1 Tax=Brevibacterium otitidis TaxID=53364 RepID=A0ABV5X6D6_9MICO